MPVENFGILQLGFQKKDVAPLRTAFSASFGNFRRKKLAGFMKNSVVINFDN
jgi:hypothetical protein